QSLHTRVAENVHPALKIGQTRAGLTKPWESNGTALSQNIFKCRRRKYFPRISASLNSPSLSRSASGFTPLHARKSVPLIMWQSLVAAEWDLARLLERESAERLSLPLT